MNNCPFCNPERELIFSNSSAYAIYDKYPVSPGHLLIIPRKHIADYFDLSETDKNALWHLVEEAKAFLIKEYKPDGFNVGFNVNEAAGQTIFHVHIHVIPRYKGDMEDPRGGVRGVIDGKRGYG